MRSATELRNAILTAARAEFALYGLAGARIDRIAKEASASKERLYAHFGDKESLFREVVSADAAELARAIEFQPEGVHEVAGIVFDFVRERPEHLRMITWAQLEAGIDFMRLVPLQKYMARAAETIRQAQAAKLVDPSWEPMGLLGLLMSISLSRVQWPEFDSRSEDGPEPIARYRESVVEAAARILAPASRADDTELED